MITIPSTSRQFTQSNTSDNLGVLYATKNCDFETNRGALRLGRRMVLNTATADVAELTSYPVGFRYFASAYWTVAGLSGTGYPFKSSAIDGNFSKVVNGGGISGLVTTFDSLYSDIETGFGELNISNASDGKVYYSADGLTWSTISSACSAGNTAMMAYFSFTNRMYITKGGNTILSWNSSHSLASAGTANTLTLGTGEIITFIRTSTTRIWIGTVSQSGGKGLVYEWDGISTNFQKVHRLEASGALACVIKNDAPWVIDSNGGLNGWNGGTFVRVTGFFRKSGKHFFNPFYASNQRFIHPNGVSVVGGRINCLVDLTYYDVASHLGTQDECNPSGIWEYDDITRDLKHKHSLGLTKSGGTINDYGQFRIFGAGALAEIITAQSPITTNGTFLAGASYYTSATATTSGIFYEDSNDTLKKAGYFITPKFQAGADKQSLTDTWNKVYVFHKNFLSDSDKLVVKYRTSEDSTEGTITWVNTTSFTTALDLSTYSVGDEVEVLNGTGAGTCSHITSITVVLGGYTVVVDETLTGVTGTARARISTWKKAGTVQDTEEFDEVPVEAVSSWIQFKVYMIWTGANEFSKAVITNQVNKKTT